MPINVVKRDGTRVPLDLSKIQTQIARACDNISNVSPSMIEIAAQIQFFEGMTTEMIDQLLLKAMVNLIDINEQPDVGHTNYQYSAGRQRLAMLRKQVYGSYDPPRLYDIVKKNVDAGVYTTDLLTWYTEAEWDAFDTFVDHDKDEKYSYAAVEQFVDKYLVRNRVTGQYYETPQVRYIVAAATAFHDVELNPDRRRDVQDYYEAASDGLFTLATPVLAGLGTPTKQFSSCVLLRSDDNLKSIFATGEMMANYAAKRAGIGLEIGRVRPLGAPIRGGEIAHTGIVPFLKKWFGDLRSCSQGGIRNASATVSMQIWHYQFDDFIVLKNTQGTEENRVRHLDYNVVLSAFFWRRFSQNGNITFFDPNEVPDLYEAFYSDTALFEKLYCAYEKRTDLRKKTERAQVVFGWIIKERTDTGRIYLTYIDNVIKHTPFDVKTDPIYQSNLCVEILLPTRPFNRVEDNAGRIALCTLGSMNIGAFRNPTEMQHSSALLVRSLSNLLAYQDFLSPQSKIANDEFRPLGIGITNLAYWHAKRNFKYGTPEALAEVKRWQEHLTYYTVEESVRLAETRGPCSRAHTTCYAKGIFPWEKRAEGVNELTDFTPSLDWEPLRQRMVAAGGTHNATLGAIAPVESSSVVIDSTNGIEMPMSLITTKESKGSSLTQVVPEYNRLKNRYELMWEQTDCVEYLKTAAVLAAYIDQSISTNTFYSPKHFPDRKVPITLVIKNLMLAHHWGLRTFYYSLMHKDGAKNTEEIATNGAPAIQVVEEEYEACESCTL